jgi:predicted metal-dependent HD superfamily phosphohydrolase
LLHHCRLRRFAAGDSFVFDAVPLAFSDAGVGVMTPFCDPNGTRGRFFAAHTGSVTAYLGGDLRRELLARWSEPHRRHHNVIHLREMLGAIESLADDGLQFDRDAVELAAWFHNAVYDVTRDDNEDRSADLARELLGSAPLRDEVARLVLLTKTHDVADGDMNGAVLNDADMSILGSAPDRYRSYARGVREEYAHISDAEYAATRVRLLTALLDGPLYFTEPGRRRWEAQARRNVADEIRRLGG